MKSECLEKLYIKYKIANLSYGIIHDKLGDLYEEYCLMVLNNSSNLKAVKSNENIDTLEFDVFKSVLSVYGINDFSNIAKIDATNEIPLRDTHGLSKTDVIMKITYLDGATREYAISCKQSTVAKMAFAEFDVDTICKEVGITNERLRYLMLKHQTDKSAKHFTLAEKEELKALLGPIAREFVRWVITGSPDENPNQIVFPTSILKFKLKKPKDRYNIDLSKGDFSLISFDVVTVEEYIDYTMLTKKRTVKSSGFGTGLCWTYATGSGGYKIQFKA